MHMIRVSDLGFGGGGEMWWKGVWLGGVGWVGVAGWVG